MEMRANRRRFTKASTERGPGKVGNGCAPEPRNKGDETDANDKGRVPFVRQ